MTRDESINKVLSRIQELHIQENRIEQQEDRLRRERQGIKEERQELFEELKSGTRRKRSTETKTSTSARPSRGLCRFDIGDKVYITNKITVPRQRTENEGDRKAVVQSITYDRTNLEKSVVYIKTDNGFETKRNAEYLQHLNPPR